MDANGKEAFELLTLCLRQNCDEFENDFIMKNIIKEFWSHR